MVLLWVASHLPDTQGLTLGVLATPRLAPSLRSPVGRHGISIALGFPIARRLAPSPRCPSRRVAEVVLEYVPMAGVRRAPAAEFLAPELLNVFDEATAEEVFLEALQTSLSPKLGYRKRIGPL